jgi:tRNA threonylcarbamoyladenosine biosynthesis protein TsaB
MILALDTATRLISLALHDGQHLAAESTWLSGTHHSVDLAPQVALLLRRAGVEVAGLRGVAVAIGPGSYTALRIGLGFAKGLALAQSLPLFGIPTLDGLMRAQPQHAGPALALLPAGRGRVSVVPYQWNGLRRRWEAAGEARIRDWPALTAELASAAVGLPGTPTLVVGELDPAGREQLRALRGAVVLAGPAQSLRRAGYLAEIAWSRWQHNEADDPSRLAPIYGGALEGAPALAE